jgi:hypothetical protein
MKQLSLSLTFLLVFSLSAFAQVQVNWPEDGLVFQRQKPSVSATTRVYFLISSTNGATITTSNVSVKFRRYDKFGNIESAVHPATGSAQTANNGYTAMTVTEGANSCKVRGYFDIRAGMYQIQTKIGSSESGTQDLGLGEVLVIAGQSNAAGYSKESVTSIPYSYPKYVRYNNKKISLENSDPGSGTFGATSDRNFIWYWGKVGQQLVEHFEQKEGKAVPVAFYQTAWSSSLVSDWVTTMTPGQNSPRFAQPESPGINLRNIISNNDPNSYINKVGVRGILWHQGEGDYAESTTNYDVQLDRLIRKVRSDTVANNSNLAWVIARASFRANSVDTRPTGTIVQAQNRVIGYQSGTTVKSYGDPSGYSAPEKAYRYTGPNTDNWTASPAYRHNDIFGDKTHFNSGGQTVVANEWATSMTQNFNGQNFFDTSIPKINNAASVVYSAGSCGLAACDCGFTLQSASQNSGQASGTFVFNSCNASQLQWSLLSGSTTVASGTIFPTSGTVNFSIPSTVNTGNYTLRVSAVNCSGTADISFPYTKPGQPIQVCDCGFALYSASQNTGQASGTFVFASCNASQLQWTLLSGSTAVATGTVSPSSPTVNFNIPSSVNSGSYTLRVNAINCSGTADIPFPYTKPGAPLQACDCGFSLQSASQNSGQASGTFIFNSCNASQLQWSLLSGSTSVASGTVFPTSGIVNFTIPSSVNSGSYTLRVNAVNCSGTADISFPYTKPCPTCRVGMDRPGLIGEPEISETEVFTIFPNPSSGSVKVKYYTEQPRAITLKIYDKSGKVMKEFKANSIKGINENELDIRNLPNANYIINLIDGAKSASKEIIKIK